VRAVANRTLVLGAANCSSEPYVNFAALTMNGRFLCRRSEVAGRSLALRSTQDIDSTGTSTVEIDLE